MHALWARRCRASETILRALRRKAWLAGAAASKVMVQLSNFHSFSARLRRLITSLESIEASSKMEANIFSSAGRAKGCSMQQHKAASSRMPPVSSKAHNKEGHPSRRRERARQASHDKKAKRWESSYSHNEGSGEWDPDRYFDEKWTHTTGRLSDWRLPRDERTASTHPARSRHSHERRSHDRSIRSLGESMADEAADEAQPPRGVDFDTRRQFYAEQLEKELNASSSDEQDAMSAGGSLERTQELDSPAPGGLLSASGRGETERGFGDDGSTARVQSFSARDQVRGSRWSFYATCHPGLESSVAGELAGPSIGADDIAPGSAGVSFWGDGLEVGFRACMWLRSAIRVLVLLAECRIDTSLPSGQFLYNWAREAVDWPALIQRGQQFSVQANVWGCETIPSSALICTRVKDAICDSVMDSRREKLQPPEKRSMADVPLYVKAYGGSITLYRDMSGESLHRRGYRSAMHKASLNESAAAGLLLLSGWEPLKPGALVDPMCGSGTFLIEAALIAQGRPPGVKRQSWPFLQWPDADLAAWSEITGKAREAEGSAGRVDIDLQGNDIHDGALSLARRDAKDAGLLDMISFSSGSCASWQPRGQPQTVLTNPPWGGRLSGSPPSSNPTTRWEETIQSQAGNASDAEVDESWRQLSVFLKTYCRNSTACILTGNSKKLQHLGLRASEKHALRIGGVDCRFNKYEILPSKTW